MGERLSDMVLDAPHLFSIKYQGNSEQNSTRRNILLLQEWATHEQELLRAGKPESELAVQYDGALSHVHNPLVGVVPA